MQTTDDIVQEASRRLVGPQAALTARVLAGKEFIIKTGPCLELLTKMLEWLSAGLQGAIVYGFPRLGKTFGARWVLSQLRIAFGKTVPWVEVPLADQSLPHEGAFFQYLLRRASHPHYRSGGRQDKRDRFTEAMVALASRSPIRTVVLLLDEAQFLDVKHFVWLLNVANELDAEGYRLFCLLVGQEPDLMDLKSRYIQDGLSQLVGRFMIGEWRFSGLTSAEQLGSCLSEMDEVKVPRKIGKPFPAHYVPQAYEAGWRLQQTQQLLWSGLSDLWISLRKDSVAIPMHYLSSTVCFYLAEMHINDGPALAHSEQAIKKAIGKSGLAEALAAYPMGEAEENSEEHQPESTT